MKSRSPLVCLCAVLHLGAEPAPELSRPSAPAARPLAPDEALVIAEVDPAAEKKALAKNLELKSARLHVIETFAGSRCESPLKLVYLCDATPDGVSTVDFAPSRRYLLLLKRGEGGWHLTDPWRGVRAEGAGGIGELRALAPTLLAPVSAAGPVPDARATAEVERLVPRLGTEEWKERDAATAGLLALGRDVAPLLRAAHAAATDAEVLTRLESVLASLTEERWRGWYRQNEVRHPFTLILRREEDGRFFTGRIVEPRIDWGPEDAREMTAGVTDGLEDSGRMAFTKTYDAACGGNVWEYTGRILGNRTIWGVWDGAEDIFYMVREDPVPGPANTTPVEADRKPR